MSEILYPLTLKSSVSVLKIVKLKKTVSRSFEIKTNAVNIALLADEKMKVTNFSSSPLRLRLLNYIKYHELLINCLSKLLMSP